MISSDHEKPLACWISKDLYQDEVLNSLTVIFRTGGCAWDRCTMCGYRHERYHGLSGSDLTARLLSQIAWVMAAFDKDRYQMVKIFTSGSFFDPDEVPEPARLAAAEAFSGKVIIAETRPEYVDAERLGAVLEAADTGAWDRPLYVAMGLETTNDQIREKCINKGFTFEDFKHAAAVSHQSGAGVKAYLLMKPLFLTEREALEDMHHSIQEAAPFSDLISMNPCTVQSRTDLERFWRQRAYRPPYLWSVLDALIRADPHVTCDPVGGGKMRGPHNCRHCDREIVDGIRTYSLTGDRGLLDALMEIDCSCKREWEYLLEEEMPSWMPLTR